MDGVERIAEKDMKERIEEDNINEGNVQSNAWWNKVVKALIV